ncbi:MAG TPA: type IV toxin-antitoxin system AbiEi family antitoxin domain-containing protein [Acidimicrobiales bacterium]|nr:type IV toxin-antitoxin system AbiEi family antitoxin domain-containing protein [Acidimicrobiales bacterium]
MDEGARTALCRLAEGQCGLFSAAQAAQLGITRGQLYWAARHGQLRRPRPGVYAFAGSAVPGCEPLVAAALAVGPYAVISHVGAAALHNLYGAVVGSCGPELFVPRERNPNLSGVVIHRTGPLSRADLAVKHGVRVTSPARTIVDLAGRYTLHLLGRVLDEALIERRLSVAALKACLERAAPNAPGRSHVQQLLSLRSEGPAADSMLEVKAFDALRPLSPFKAHFLVGVGKSLYVIDAAWPDKRVGAEIIGRTHRVASRSAFDQERRKLNDLASVGWRIAHLTSAMSADEMLETVRRLI